MTIRRWQGGVFSEIKILGQDQSTGGGEKSKSRSRSPKPHVAKVWDEEQLWWDIEAFARSGFDSVSTSTKIVKNE